MKNKVVRLLALAVFALTFLLSATVHAQTQPTSPSSPSPVFISGTQAQKQRATLAGLTSFSAVVIPVKPDIEAAGLHFADLQADTEAALRKAGIKLIPMSGRDARRQAVSSGAAGLVFTPQIRKQGNFYMVFILTEVYREVIVPPINNGEPAQRITLPTWRSMDYNVLGADKLGQVRQHLQSAVAAFIADYKAANGNKAPATE